MVSDEGNFFSSFDKPRKVDLVFFGEIVITFVVSKA